MRQQNEQECAHGAEGAHGEVEGPQRHEAAEPGKDQAADDTAGSRTYPSDQANESGRGVEVAATPTEEVRKRERASRSGEKDDRDEHFTPFDQGDEVAEKLREGFAGEAEGLAPA